MISIIIPYYNDEKYIVKLVAEIEANNIKKDEYEVLIIDGKSNLESRAIIEEIATNHPNIKILDNVKRITPCAINIGINESKGEYIILLSAHCGIAPNYIQTLIDECESLNADVIGAVGKTETLGNSHQELAIKYVLSNKFGVGNALYRIGIDSIKEVDTVAYACYRKDIFKKLGLFDEKLVRNQDLEFNKRVKNHNGKIYLTPDTYFVYYARNNYKDLYRNNFGNGYWSIVTPYLLGEVKSESLRHYIPFIFVMTILISLMLSIIFRGALLIGLGIISVYLLFVLANSIDIKLKRDRGVRIRNLMFAFIVLHFSYGFGSLKAFLDILRGKYKLEKSER